ncbi:hypothetical protein NM688_g2844 [Phlebia brevispora]|uniref:Uncharacterized protein n=1 Tax=Phlebia brevispora TaxID=194682 RepID=A0ACC1T7N2_9APHY|nr:hypothetical protein NM688_g2844 [Phlebia brevispora]
MATPLCLCGFEENQTLEEILDNEDTRFLYRVSRYNQIAPRTSHMFAAKYRSWSEDPQTIPRNCEFTLDDLHQHIDPNRRKSFWNPWLCTSLSFLWIIWRSVDWGRYEREENFVISVIDARHETLRDRLMLTIDGLKEKGGDHDRDSFSWLTSWSHQEVLVHGYIDYAAVVARVPWIQVKNLLVPEYLTPLHPGPVTFRSWCHQVKASLTDGWRPTAAYDAAQVELAIFDSRLHSRPASQAELLALRDRIVDVAVSIYLFPRRPRPESADILKGVPGLRRYQMPRLIEQDIRYVRLAESLE